MAGNAHRNRHGNVAGCAYCALRPKQVRKINALFKNRSGHRRNPTRKRRRRSRRNLG